VVLRLDLNGEILDCDSQRGHLWDGGGSRNFSLKWQLPDWCDASRPKYDLPNLYHHFPYPPDLACTHSVLIRYLIFHLFPQSHFPPEKLHETSGHPMQHTELPEDPGSTMPFPAKAVNSSRSSKLQSHLWPLSPSNISNLETTLEVT
jgi:hypothetical protein